MAAHVRSGGTQGGFSVVEMLMVSFILGVGLLGLTALQVMTLRSTRGSRSLGTAILVAEQVLDRAELEGRLSWLNLTAQGGVTPDTATDLPNLTYVPLAPGASLMQTFSLRGLPVVTGSADPQDRTPWYTATTTRTAMAVGAQGRLSRFTVEVVFQEDLDASQAAVQRTVRVSRVIAHG